MAYSGAAVDVRVTLKLDVLKAVSQQPGMEAMLGAKARAVKARAEATAPVNTGRYRDSFQVEFAQTDRRVARVVNTVPYALYVEYGGSVTVRHRTLGAALDAAGGSG